MPAPASRTGRDTGQTGRIPLSDGSFALVDAADFVELSKHKWNCKRSGLKSTRYAQRSVRLGPGRGAPKTSLAMHRVIAGAGPGQQVDHINGNTLDNRRCNLRVCTPSQNAMNVRSSKNQKRGGYKGVVWHKRAKKWEAYICAGDVKPNGKRRRLYLGLYRDAADAARAYDAAALRYFGEFAGLNFPQSEVA